MKVSELHTEIETRLWEIRHLRGLIIKRLYEIAFEVFSGYEDYKTYFLSFLDSRDPDDDPYWTVLRLKKYLEETTEEMIELEISNEWDTNYRRVPRRLIELFIERI